MNKTKSYKAGEDYVRAYHHIGGHDYLIDHDMGPDDDIPPDDYHWLITNGIDPDTESYREGFNDARKALGFIDS